MLDEAGEDFDVLVETISPQSLSQLQVAVELTHKAKDNSQLAKGFQVDLYRQGNTFSVMLSGNFSKISCHLLTNTKRPKHLVS